jgi:Ca-activated chloride channel family protein
MNLTPHSPELTAYVLGELPDDQRREVEAILAVRPDLQWEVDQLRSLTATVTLALQAEPVWTLSPARRRLILDRSPLKANWFRWAWPRSIRDPRRLLPLLQWAGASLAAIACGLLWWEFHHPVNLDVSMPTLAYVEPANSLANTYPLASRSLEKEALTTRFSTNSPIDADTQGRVPVLGREKRDLARQPKSVASPAVEVPSGEASAKPALAIPNAGASTEAAAAVGEVLDNKDRAAGRSFHFQSAATTGSPPAKELPDNLSPGLGYPAGQQLSPLAWSTSSPPRMVRFARFDDSGYRLVRTRILEGTRPLPEFIRLEELINYFRYEDVPEKGSARPDLLKTRFEWSVCPWNPGHVLVRVALQWGDRTNGTASGPRLMLAVDGTKAEPFALLPDWLGGANKNLIVSTDPGEIARESLDASGSMARKFSRLERRTAAPTQQLAGSDGFTVDLQRAYEVAKAPSISNVDRPVILATPPGRVTGISATNPIQEMIRNGIKDGVRLDIVALGVDPQITPQLAYWAGLGGGRLVTADTKADGRRAFGELAQPIKSEPFVEWPAADLSWDTNRFPTWRGLGNVATTEMNAPFTALPEVPALQLADGIENRAQPSVVSLGSQYVALFELAKPEIGFLSLGGFGGAQFKSESLSTKVEGKPSSALKGTPPSFSEASVDFKFTTAVAGFGLLLRNSEDHEGLTWDQVLEMAKSGVGSDPDGTRAEFVELVKRARELK